MPRVLNPNTTYQYTFDGPSLKCDTAVGTQLANISAVYTELQKKIGAEVLQSFSTVPDIKYLSFSFGQDEKGTIVHPNASAFVSDCVLGKRLTGCTTPRAGPVLYARLGNESITCSAYTTRFTLDFYASGASHLINQTTSEHEFLALAPPQDSTMKLYNTLTNMLNGYVGIFTGGGASGGFFSEHTNIVDTALLEPLQRSWEDLRSLIPQEDWMASESRSFSELIEELSRNQTLSLFSSKMFWLPAANASTANVTQTTFLTVYEYRPRNLWLAYGIAIAFSLAGVLLGLHALWTNGVAHDNSFSSIVATTRNGFLDDLSRGYSLGAAPVPRSIAETRLVFGELGGEKGLRAGFGLEGETRALLRGQVIH